ncbi:MAG: hypothetical protein ABIR59_08910 [Gemmatimonadales bacterium]
MNRKLCALAGLALLIGCGGVPTATDAVTSGQGSFAKGKADEAKALADLRQATEKFHDFAAAEAAGWSTQITGCVSNSGVGAMGFHYGNVSLINGTVRPDAPQLLLYEPQKNGNMRLVGVEYIIPYSFVSRDSPAPVLFGQEFSQVDAFGLWGLHVWVWRENPAGMYEAWNAKVTCDNAPASASMSHH